MNGVDLATLGLRVDARPVQDATRALDQFTQSSAKAETQSKAFGLSADEVARINRRTFREIAQAEERWQAEKANREQAAAARSKKVAEESARAQIAALERAFQEERSEIRLAVASGFLTPKEAEKAGRDTARRYNQGLAEAIGSARSVGGFVGREGRQELVGITGTLKNVGKEGRRAGLGLGRLNNAMVVVARQATGTNPIVGRLVDTVGTFAIGTAYMIPVLAGLAAIGLAWAKITDEARAAKKEQDEAVDSLLRAARLRELGPAGEPAEDLAAATARQEQLRRQIATIESSRVDPRSITGVATGAGIAAGDRDKRLADLRKQLEETDRAVAEGRAQVFESVKRANERLNDERERGNTDAERAAAEAARIAERRAASLKRLADETARREAASAQVVAGLDVELDAEQRRAQVSEQGAAAQSALNLQLQREAALRQALAGAVPADVKAITDRVNAIYDLRAARQQAADASGDLSDSIADEFEASGAGIDRYRESIEETTERQARFTELTVSGLRDVGAAFGDVGKAVAGLGASLLSVQAEFSRTKDEIARLLEAGFIDEGEARRRGQDAAQAFQDGLSAAATAGAVGFIASAVGSILSGRSRRAREIEEARAEFDRVLDDYVDTLAGRSRFEQLAVDAKAGAQGAFDALIDGILAPLDARGGQAGDFADKIRERIEGGISSDGLEKLLEGFGPEGQRILEAYRAKLEQIAEQRQAEIDAMSGQLEVETLRLQGLDDEADALALSLRYQSLMADAMALADDALIAMVDTWYAAATAAREVAKAEEEAAEARRRASAHRDFVADLGILQARNRGDDAGAAIIEAQVRAAQKIADARKLFDEGIIDQATLDAFIEAVGVELTNAIENATEAVKQAAAAEEHRASMEMGNLQLRLLYANGLGDEALLLKQSLELQDAVFQGKSDEYIATLKQVHAAERAAAQARKQTQATREQARASEEATRAIDGMSRALGGPAGFTEDLALYRNRMLRNASSLGDPFGVGSATPRFGGAAGGTLRIEAGAIVVHAAPGQDPGQVADAVINEVARRKRAGGINPVGGII